MLFLVSIFLAAQANAMPIKFSGDFLGVNNTGQRTFSGSWESSVIDFGQIDTSLARQVLQAEVSRLNIDETGSTIDFGIDAAGIAFGFNFGELVQINLGGLVSGVNGISNVRAPDFLVVYRLDSGLRTVNWNIDGYQFAETLSGGYSSQFSSVDAPNITLIFIIGLFGLDFLFRKFAIRTRISDG
ncbi:MAG: hypothetical protein ACJAR0_003683 [Candidatus Azotimanducaceae bacterium]|jgi:hypothetical protein